MSDFETVPVGTMAELVRIQDDWERLRDERDAYQDMAQCLSSDLTSMGEERDALAALIEDARDAYMQDRPTELSRLVAVGRVLNLAPETRLARRDARMKAEALKILAEEFRKAWPEHNGKHAWILGAMGKLRRQAEEVNP